MTNFINIQDNELDKATKEWFKKIRDAQKNEDLTIKERAELTQPINSEAGIWNKLLKKDYYPLKRKDDVSKKDLNKALKRGEKRMKEVLRKRLKHFIEH